MSQILCMEVNVVPYYVAYILLNYIVFRCITQSHYITPRYIYDTSMQYT